MVWQSDSNPGLPDEGPECEPNNHTEYSSNIFIFLPKPSSSSLFIQRERNELGLLANRIKKGDICLRQSCRRLGWKKNLAKESVCVDLCTCEKHGYRVVRSSKPQCIYQESKMLPPVVVCFFFLKPRTYSFYVIEILTFAIMLLSWIKKNQAKVSVCVDLFAHNVWFIKIKNHT